MRKVGLVLGAAAVLGLAVACPLPAQQPVTFNTGAKSATSQLIDINTMLPNMNMNKALVTPGGGGRTFAFGRMLPSFGFLDNRWPTKRSYSMIEQKYFYPFFQPAKKK